MLRQITSLTTSAVVLVACAATASGQQWARDMAEITEHDFEVVARGSDTVFKFPIKNIYKEDVVLGSVRSSCGCTSPSIEHPTIKTYETGYVVAKFNTRTFTGFHSATLTLSILKPYPAQLQLKVRGNIRGDVVFEPGSVDFGQVDQGTPHEKVVTVRHTGRSSWQLTDVRSSSDHLDASLVERQRVGGRVAYDLSVRLRESAPAGFLKTQLVLVTNDGANPRVPLAVEAEVRPELTVSPGSIVLGDIPQGETVTKRLLVRGKRPFRVTNVTCEDDRFSFEASEASDTKQIITLRFASRGETSRLRAPVTITTDLGESFTATCDVYATVTPSEVTADQGATSAGARESHTAAAN